MLQAVILIELFNSFNLHSYQLSLQIISISSIKILNLLISTNLLWKISFTFSWEKKRLATKVILYIFIYHMQQMLLASFNFNEAVKLKGKFWLLITLDKFFFFSFTTHSPSLPLLVFQLAIISFYKLNIQFSTYHIRYFHLVD